MTNKKIASEFAIGIVLLIAVVFGGIVWMQNKKAENTIVSQSPVRDGGQQFQVQQTCPDNFYRMCSDGTYISDCTQSCPTYDLNSLDPKLWTKYTNDKLGFSMMIPKNNQLDDKTHPVTVVEKNNDVTIATKNLPSGYTSKDASIEIKLRQAKSDEDINHWLATDFLGNSDCKVGRKDVSAQSGTYDVTINPVENCITNFAYVLRYDPSRQLVAFWIIGQSNKFLVPLDTPVVNDGITQDTESADQTMAASFQFIDFDQAANLQVYSNEKYGFQFQYPKDLAADQNTNVDYFSLDIQEPNAVALQDTDQPFGISIDIKKTDYKTTNTWFSAFKKDFEKPSNYEGTIISPEITSITNITIGGVNAKEYIPGGGNFPFNNRCTGFVKGGYEYSICYGGGVKVGDYADAKIGTNEYGNNNYDQEKIKSAQAEYVKLFDQILTSFKFTN